MCTLTHRDSALPRLPRVAQAVQADGDLRVAPVVVVIAGVVTVVASAITVIASDVRQPDPCTPQVFCHSSNTHSKVSDKYPHEDISVRTQTAYSAIKKTTMWISLTVQNPKTLHSLPAVTKKSCTCSHLRSCSSKCLTEWKDIRVLIWLKDY